MNFMKAIVAAGLVAASTSAFAADITGAGSTFIYPVLSKWADAYKKDSGNGVNYQSIGSGAGIKQIQAKTVTFGATDMPLTVDQLEKDGLAQWPMIMGAIVPVVNIEGVKAGEMALDGQTLADIYSGKITKWDDPAIKKLNPKLNLPSAAIAVVHRADGSGTTFNFTDYLSKVSPDWKSKVGSGTAVEWPVGVGAKGNEGVSGNVGQTKDAIGYVEYAYAKQNKLTYVKLMNKAGKAVAPSIESFSAAAANANWEETSGFGVILTNELGAASWPIAGATFILMPKQPSDPAAAAEALKFFHWAYAKGGKLAEELDYVPMPANVIAAVERLWAGQMQNAQGAPLFVPPK